MRYASPTFLFREVCPKELSSVMKRLAGIGFEGIELYGTFGHGSHDIRRFCAETGLSIVCDHIRYDEFSGHTQALIDGRAAIGAEYLTIDNIPADRLPGTPGFPEAVREIERIARLCRAAGIQLLYHNHGYDLIRKVDGIPLLDLILDGVDPELLKFQPDLGWLRLGGADPARYLAKYGRRCRIVHLKDYYASGPVLLESPFPLGNRRGGPEHSFFEFRPSGYGVMNYPALMPSVLACEPEWITVDHDLSYERDTYRDMEMSLTYVRQLASLY